MIDVEVMIFKYDGVWYESQNEQNDPQTSQNNSPCLKKRQTILIRARLFALKNISNDTK